MSLLDDLKIIRSKVWPHVWVVTITWWESPKVSSRSENFLASTITRVVKMEIRITSNKQNLSAHYNICKIDREPIQKHNRLNRMSLRIRRSIPCNTLESCLWITMLRFNAEGQKFVNEYFSKPTQWTYQKETLHLSSSRRDASGAWLVTPEVKNLKHVFVFFEQRRKHNALTKSP